MQLSSLLLVFCALFAAASAAVMPRASSRPECTYTCKEKNKNNWGLGLQTYEGGKLVCEYKKAHGHHGEYYYSTCKYNKNDGSLKFDGGYCPMRAKPGRYCSQRRELKDAYEHEQERRAAEPAAEVPKYMQTRNNLRRA